MEESGLHQNSIHFWGNTCEEDFYTSQNIKSFKSFYTPPRGISLFTRSWLPLQTPPRGIICMVHGLGEDISWTFQATSIYLAQMGFACFAIDLEGHGHSQGLRSFIPNLDLVVNDCLSYFNLIQLDQQFHGLPTFLYGESMGGAICLLIHFASPNAFDGAILVAPMCKISDKKRPSWPIPEILTVLAKVMPTLPIVPMADRKSKKAPKIAGINPLRYSGKPRLGTILELLRVTDYLNKRMFDVSLPFIVLHGSADVATDPDVSRALYEEAKSKDKTIKIYDGMKHSLLFWDTDENVETVRRDIVSWLNDRCKKETE